MIRFDRLQRRMALAAAAVAVAATAAMVPLSPAKADGWHRHHGWHGGPSFGVYFGGPAYAPAPVYYAPPPVYYAPPPPVYYAPPPPVYYAPPPFGLNVVIPLHFN